MGVIETNNYHIDDNRQQRADRQSGNDQQQEIMCWKDPNKTCKCERPRQGEYCGRYPVPTD